MSASFELYEALRSIGVEEARARATAEKFDAALERRFSRELANLATREDLARLETALREQMRESDEALREEMHGFREALGQQMREGDEALREELHGFRETLDQQMRDGDEALREGIGRLDVQFRDLASEMRAMGTELRREMASLETRLIKWNVGTILAVAMLTVALVKLVG